MPEVASISYDFGSGIKPAFVLCLGINSYPLSIGGSAEYITKLYSLVWGKDDFSTAKIITDDVSDQRGSIRSELQTLFRYNRKNDGEMVLLYFNRSGASGSPPYASGVNFISYPEGIYDTYREGLCSWSGAEPLRTSAVAGNGRYIYRCFVQNGKLNLRAGSYNPNEPYASPEPIAAAVQLPSRANVFPDSICYAANQDLWFVFVGTGIAFSQKPEEANSWGYLDTQETLGVITQSGCLEYDPEENVLFISGQDTTNQGKIGVLQLPELYNYANDGAWLPSISSDGIPAYIKAKEAV